MATPTRQPTAGEVATRIINFIGVRTRPNTVDNFLAGDPNTPVTGVIVTMMATIDVLHRAVEMGANLVVTHEGVYFNHENALVEQLVAEDDPVYFAKSRFIEEYGLVIFHLHDHWHDVRPDGIDYGTLDALGWQIPDNLTYPATLQVPTTTLGVLASHVARSLGANSLRYIGEPDLRVRYVGLALGFRGSDMVRALMRRDDVDVVLMGEGHEWEIGEYAYDAVALGSPKGLIVIGHIPSEQQGMAWATKLITAGLPGLPVTFVPCADPFRML